MDPSTQSGVVAAIVTVLVTLFMVSMLLAVVAKWLYMVLSSRWHRKRFQTVLGDIESLDDYIIISDHLGNPRTLIDKKNKKTIYI
jgi:hypothetical protein